jgi:hypothetical protein
MATVLAPLGSSARSQRRHDSAIKKRFREKSRGDSNVAPEWDFPSAVNEAHCMLDFMLRNRLSVQEMTSLIGVSDAEYLALCTWAADKPGLAAHLENAMCFRDRVLKAFLVLVEGLEAERSEAQCLESMSAK